ncbi:MAG: hypothetical protein GY863_12505, partial [bacterium]|nr:hypothetical protein [bacterium]
MKRGGFKSIRRRLTFWFLLVSIIPLAAAITIVYFQRINAIKEREFTKLSTIRDLKVKQIDQWFEERRGDLSILSGNHEIKDFFGILDVTKYNEKQKYNIEYANRILDSFLKNYKAYSELFIINANTGIVELSTDKKNIGRNV